MGAGDAQGGYRLRVVKAKANGVGFKGFDLGIWVGEGNRRGGGPLGGSGGMRRVEW